jgi:hypothetical protein
MRRRVAGLLLGVLVLTLLAWAPAAAAARCLIINDALNASYRSLQPAQDAAAAGATLWVRGSCVGTTTLTKDLTLTGQQPPGFTSPTLDGAGQGSVLTITEGVTVTINTLTIRGGNAERGGGILNDGGTNDGGPVTLNHSTVSDNTADRGGGIFNADRGGSIFEAELGRVTLNGSSSVSGNDAPDGGGIFNEGGAVTLNDTSSISSNHAEVGGGIRNNRIVNLNNSSSISDNIAEFNGGGIFNDPGGTVNLNGGTVTGNIPDDIFP